MKLQSSLSCYQLKHHRGIFWDSLHSFNRNHEDLTHILFLHHSLQIHLCQCKSLYLLLPLSFSCTLQILTFFFSFLFLLLISIPKFRLYHLFFWIPPSLFFLIPPCLSFFHPKQSVERRLLHLLHSDRLHCQ